MVNSKYTSTHQGYMAGYPLSGLDGQYGFDINSFSVDKEISTLKFLRGSGEFRNWLEAEKKGWLMVKVRVDVSTT
jgi:hypothetical protein